MPISQTPSEKLVAFRKAVKDRRTEAVKESRENASAGLRQAASEGRASRAGRKALQRSRRQNAFIKGFFSKSS